MHPYQQHFPVRCADDRLDVVSFLECGLATTPDRTIFEFGDDKWTVGRFARHVAGMQSWLEQRGMRRSQRVAVMLDNSPDHIALIAALILAGITWVPINTRQKVAGLQYVLDHCKPDLVVAGVEYRDLWQKALEASSHHCECVALPQISIDTGMAMPTRADIQPLDTLCIMYTSGTTGAPKGVLFTHRMMRVASEAALRVAGARPGDILFLWEPLSHIGGAQMLLVPFLCKVTLHIVERFSASSLWEQMSRSQATHLHYLGGILEILMRVPVPARGTHALRTAWGAGLTVQSYGQARKLFGLELRECYGMTECSSFATLNETGKAGSIGKALPWLRVDLLDDAGEPVQDGVAAEIVISTDVEGAFFGGYLDNADATAKVLRDGRLHTGDFARRERDGDLYFVGRATDSMRIRGENVSAWEVERVLSLHPAILACAAVGVRSDVAEQDILLYVQAKPGKVMDWDSFVHWAQEQLPAYQVPRYYQRVEAFEVTPSERIRKTLLPRSTDDAWDRMAPAMSPST